MWSSNIINHINMIQYRIFMILYWVLGYIYQNRANFFFVGYFLLDVSLLNTNLNTDNKWPFRRLLLWSDLNHLLGIKNQPNALYWNSDLASIWCGIWMGYKLLAFNRHRLNYLATIIRGQRIKSLKYSDVSLCIYVRIRYTEVVYASYTHIYLIGFSAYTNNVTQWYGPSTERGRPLLSASLVFCILSWTTCQNADESCSITDALILVLFALCNNQKRLCGS